MGEATLTKTRLASGVWHGILDWDGAEPPQMRAEHLGKTMDSLEVRPNDAGKGWAVSLPIPAELLADGVQTIVICDAGSGDTLTSFSLIAGDALDDDLRAEIHLLRAELDMLKRAFRRHCLETM